MDIRKNRGKDNGGNVMIEAAVYGYGNIGSGVVEVIEKNQDVVARSIGEGVHVKYVLDLREFEGDPIQSRVVHDVDVIVNDPEIKIICETMGGNEPAYTFTKKRKYEETSFKKNINISSKLFIFALYLFKTTY